MEGLKKRLVKAMAAVVVCITIGTVGFWVIDNGQHTLLDCAFMTVITLSTVGYNEVIPLAAGGKVFTSILIVVGMGSLIFFGSTLIAFFVEFDLLQVRRRRKMNKSIDELQNHIIVCGVGTTGSKVVSELVETNTPFVMVDMRDEQLENIRERYAKSGEKILLVHGDATEDEILDQAGIQRASGLVAALRNDKDNLYVILSSRQINPKLRIISRATEPDAPPKMLRAGADRVVAPNLLGGMRIASEMIRPHVVEFLDVMIRDKEQNTRIEQVALPPGSPLVGRKLANTKIRKATDVLVIAIRNKDQKFTYNPGPESVLSDGDVLVVLGAVDSVKKLRKSLSQTNSSTTLIPR